VSKPGDEACLASEDTPLEGGFAAPSRCKSTGELWRHSAPIPGDFSLGESGGCRMEWIELVKKGGQASIVHQEEPSELNLEDGVGQLRGLLRLLL